ncbi:MAG: prolyl oligopeptidase family serine peptidase [Dysgonamonadaceae bacterium]|nr:prolyl oligopeptidase family serine peptidase [Dysgonamonadaceae bacterium]
MPYKIITLAVFMTITMGVLAQHDDYLKKEFIDLNGDTLLYRQLSPETIAENKTYPLVLFLHGAGERGSDNKLQLQHGSMQFTNPVNREAYPSFVLFPQCPEDKYWAPSTRPDKFDMDYFPLNDEISEPLGMVEKLLSQVIEEYPVDTSRIYVIGLSMGGMGVYDIVCRNPDKFAAAIAICGGVNTQRLRDIDSNTQFRLYHGDADSVVPVQFSREAYKALKETGKSVEYFEFPGVNHGSWDPAFNQLDFISWLYAQKLLKQQN